MSSTLEQREQQVKQAEELLFSGPQRLGFAKGLFYGRFVADWVSPYPCLPEDQREAFVLREEGGFNIDEIAVITGVNPETAKSRLRYAVNKLRAGLTEK